MQNLVVVLVLVGCFFNWTSGQNYSWNHQCNWCCEQSRCVRGSSCECNAGLSGDPTFFCYPPSTLEVCEICGDPVTATVSGDSSKSPVVERALLFDREINTPADSQPLCRLQVIVLNRREHGKIYVQGVLFHLTLTDSGNGDTCDVVIQVIATYVPASGRTSDFLQYDIWRMDASAPGNSGTFEGSMSPNWGSQTMNRNNINSCGCGMQFRLSSGTKGHILRIRFINCCSSAQCGIRPHVYHGLKSGVYIAIPETNSVATIPSSWQGWLGYQLCLKPSIGLADVANSLSIPRNSTYLAMFYFGLTASVFGVNLDQLEIRTILSGCTNPNRLWAFLRIAGELMRKPRFIRACSTVGGVDVRGFSRLHRVLKLLAEWLCDSSLLSCNLFRTNMNDCCMDQVNDAAVYADLNNLYYGGTCTSIAAAAGMP